MRWSERFHMNEHPRVEDLFMANPAGYARIASGDGHAFVRRQAECLLQRCALRSGIVGLEKLATDGGASSGKFASMLAEVTFALAFSSLGARVQLLRDEAFLPASYTPDLFVTFLDGFEVLVDVVRIAGGSAPLADALRSALKAKQLPYAIEQCAGLKLSIPAFDWSTHKSSEGAVRSGRRQRLRRPSGSAARRQWRRSDLRIGARGRVQGGARRRRSRKPIRRRYWGSGARVAWIVWVRPFFG